MQIEVIKIDLEKLEKENQELLKSFGFKTKEEAEKKIGRLTYDVKINRRGIHQVEVKIEPCFERYI